MLLYSYVFYVSLKFILTGNMFFEERIAFLKKYYSAADFRIPYTDASSILRTIEQHFVKYKDVHHSIEELRIYHNQWVQNLKNPVYLREIRHTDIGILLDQLGSDDHYWVVLDTESKHLVFEVSPNAITDLTSHHKGSFFIVDKKYKWLCLFSPADGTGKLDVYKCGFTATHE